MSEELVRFECRECGQRIEAPASYSKVWIQCPTCEEYVLCRTAWLQSFWRRLAERFSDGLEDWFWESECLSSGWVSLFLGRLRGNGFGSPFIGFGGFWAMAG